LKVPKDWIPERRSSNIQRFSIIPAPESRPEPVKLLPPWLSLYQQQQRSTLIPEFVEPCAQMNFLDRVRNGMVCLENCFISSGAGSISVTCVARVMNVSFEKQVLIRYTSNEWSTWTDCLASYIPQSGDGSTDRFTAAFHVRSAAGVSLSPGQRVLFAVKYVANNEEYWDNNMGLNYSLIYRL
jgi:protein phosphatase 1 regulatory subunit 3A/B/C/D/E